MSVKIILAYVIFFSSAIMRESCEIFANIASESINRFVCISHLYAQQRASSCIHCLRAYDLFRKAEGLAYYDLSSSRTFFLATSRVDKNEHNVQNFFLDDIFHSS